MRRHRLAFGTARIDALVQGGWLLFLVIWAALQGWQSRYFEFFGDSISYQDMADHFRHNDWAGGISAWWGPLYPLIIAFFFRAIHTDAFHEFAALKIINLTIFLVLLGSFEYFFHVFLQFYNDQINKQESIHVLTRSTWIFIGHAIFAYSFLCLNNIAVDTPDMLMAALMFIDLAIFLKILRGQNTFTNYFLFGSVAGMAYLAKNAALPGMLVCLPFLLRQRNRTERFWQKFLLTLAALTLIILPYLLYLYQQRGELILFPGGKLNYIWFVQERDMNLTPQKILGQQLLHPTRQIFTKPHVFEFSEPLQATYPPWFDPYYWLQGSKICLKPAWIIVTAGCNAVYYFLILFCVFLIVITIVYLIYGSPIVTVQSLVSNAMLFFPALIGFLQYMYIINLAAATDPTFINRYFGVFVSLFVLASLSSLRIKKNPRGNLAIKLGIALTCFCILIPIGQQLKNDISNPLGNQPSAQYQIATELINLGLHPGDRVARIANKATCNSWTWARLARLKIVADIPAIEEFMSVTASRRQEVLQALKKYGVKVAVYFRASADIPPQVSWIYVNRSIYKRLLAVVVPGDQAKNPKPIDPPAAEGWRQLKDLPCWVHEI